MESFSPSFNQAFCEKLEYTLCDIFAQSKDPELKRFWCDGISWSPFYNKKVNQSYLSFNNVKERGRVETTAHIGVSGQVPYELKINLGKTALSLYEKNQCLIESIPPINSNWVEIDTIENKIEIQLL